MNVLFDDGSTIDRRLRFEDKKQDLTRNYLGRYHPYSEAFQYFKYVDNIWGDFMSRDMEEINYALKQASENYPNVDVAKLDSKDPIFDPYKIEFKEKFYLKRIINIKKLDGKTEIEWKDINTETVDIAALFPPKEQIFYDNHVIGVAFSIYKREVFNSLEEYNRKKTSAYYLDVRLVINGNIIEGDYPTTFNIKKIAPIEVLNIINEKWNPRIDLLSPENDKENLYRVGPTLVLNKETIRVNRNYTGSRWNEPPTDWDKMIIENPNNWELNKGKTIEFIPHKYWEFREGNTPAPRMVVRIGREGSEYVLFLHGDQEAGCPIRIPTDE